MSPWKTRRKAIISQDLLAPNHNTDLCRSVIWSSAIDIIIYSPLKHSCEVGTYLNIWCHSKKKKKKKWIWHHAWSPFKQTLFVDKDVGYFNASWWEFKDRSPLYFIHIVENIREFLLNTYHVPDTKLELVKNIKYNTGPFPQEFVSSMRAQLSL